MVCCQFGQPPLALGSLEHGIPAMIRASSPGAGLSATPAKLSRHLLAILDVVGPQLQAVWSVVVANEFSGAPNARGCAPQGPNAARVIRGQSGTDFSQQDRMGQTVDNLLRGQRAAATHDAAQARILPSCTAWCATVEKFQTAVGSVVAARPIVAQGAGLRAVGAVERLAIAGRVRRAKQFGNKAPRAVALSGLDMGRVWLISL